MNNSYERKREQVRLGTIIKDLREERGLSQQHLADAISVHRSTVSRLEHGEYDLGMSHLSALARALGPDLENFCRVLATKEVPTTTGSNPVDY